MRGAEARGVAGRAESGRGRALDEGVPAELWHDFAMHRLRRGAGAPVPAGLRDRVLEVLERGVPMREVRRVLGLRPEQVARWQRLRPRAAAGSGAGAPASASDVRVFEVAEEARDSGARGAATTTQRDDGVEVRLGGWTILVRRCAEER